MNALRLGREEREERESLRAEYVRWIIPFGREVLPARRGYEIMGIIDGA